MIDVGHVSLWCSHYISLFHTSGLEYSASPLSAQDLETNLLQSIPQVLVSRKDIVGTELKTDVLAPNHVFRVSDSEFHSIDRYVSFILENDVDGTTEDCYHGRNDHIFSIIRKLASMKRDRNAKNVSTLPDSRVDVFLFHKNFPPLVLAEEKASENDLGDAVNQLKDKFCRELPHYDPRLTWIFGIAIAGNDISFGKLHRHAKEYTEMLSLHLENTADKLLCVQAAINVARWCNWVKQSQLVYPAYVRLWHASKRSRSFITFAPPDVKKVMMPNHWNADTYTFYSTIARPHATGRPGLIPYFECATKVERTNGCLHLTLQPFGVVRSPRPSELQAAVRCILTALSALHERGWIHCDLRWDNIVWCGVDNWVIIDAEFARRIGAAMPSPALNGQDPRVDVADAAADLYAVGKMLDVPTYREVSHVSSLVAFLLGPEDKDENTGATRSVSQKSRATRSVSQNSRSQNSRATRSVSNNSNSNNSRATRSVSNNTNSNNPRAARTAAAALQHIFFHTNPPLPSPVASPATSVAETSNSREVYQDEHESHE